MKKLPLLILAIIALGALSAFAANKRGSKSAGEDTRKADYIYLEALRAKSQNNHDAAFALLQRAHELNRADKEIGVELSVYLLSLSQTDSTLFGESMDLLRDYCEANPSDFYYGSRYAMLNEQLLNRDEALKTWEKLHSLYPDRLEVTYRYAGVLAQGGPESDREKAIAVYDSVEIAEGKSIPLSSKNPALLFAAGHGFHTR